MEAANLGAYLSAYAPSALGEALQILTRTPTPKNSDAWTSSAQEVKAKFPNAQESLGIPTWFYGSEPTNLFATRIAKYFDNSIREGWLVQNAKAGIIFAPGSAGTRQEIFMDSVLENYDITGVITPMVFLGRWQYQVDSPVYPLLQEVATSKYKDFLFITDEPSEAVNFIHEHPSIGQPKG